MNAWLLVIMLTGQPVQFQRFNAEDGCAAARNAIVFMMARRGETRADNFALCVRAS